ncbi:ATP-binding protein [Pseudomonas protegens]|uniref:ATP-binding protein n=1 Tax=Pseudomonas protegens TaxID=380021 RepID=UPI002160A79E|nr:ATP-binding protein [Pseudomonas protegens]UVL73450.1 ATP-binding protein [Pseudomonas protegens]
MKFTILRLLTHSELGMFHEYRRQGKERAKQRSINFDRDVVGKVFPSAENPDTVAITCRRLEDEGTVVEIASWLKRQHKNWRFEGDCPKSSFYSFVDPGVLFAMVVDASSTPAKASWVVIPADHPARSSILGHGESAQLGKSAMIALYGEEGQHCQAVLSDHFPQLFKEIETVSVTSQKENDNNRNDDDVAPDPLGLFKILARAGHSLPSAVADLVDNSLSHGAREIDITFPNPNVGGRWMCIRDDGTGMTPSGLRDAMKIGYQREYDDGDLGKFGYGLKGAAWSQADRLTVVSKAAGNESTTLTWDKEHLAKTRRWALLSDPVAPVHASAVDIGDSGTAVLLTQMRPSMEPVRGQADSLYAKELAAIKSHLELVFHRYLEGKARGHEKVVIRLNDDVLRANNPLGHPLTKEYDQHRIELHGTSPDKTPALYVRAYVTPHEEEFEECIKDLPPLEQRVERDRHSLNGRANDAQGLYFYRLDRLIKWGGWEDLFAKDEHTKLIRVAVDFDRLADEQLQVDISKQLIRLPFAIRKPLMDLLKTPRSEARLRYKKEKAAPTPKGVGKAVLPAGIPAPSGFLPPTTATEGAPVTAPAPAPAAKKDRTPIRLVSSGDKPWQRKIGFKGEEVEVTPLMPTLVTLVQLIDKDAEAKSALSEFLRALEMAGVPDQLTEKV